LKILLSLFLGLLPFNMGRAITAIDTDLVSKSVVFFFAADSTGVVLKDKQVATGFLIMVPSKNGLNNYPLLVTARHVVDPIWAGCASINPTRLFARVNKKRFDPLTDESGVSYISVELIQNGSATWLKSDDENVDVAVLKAPPELLSNDYDIRFINFRNLGKPDEIAKLGVGSQTASAGLVPGLEGRKRNYPIFQFGKIASVPTNELAFFQCRSDSQARGFRVWWLATTLVPGTSGSPIFFDPLFPPGADVSAGEPRVMIIGLQSLARQGANLAGITPARYIIEVITRSVPNTADLSLGLPAK
jgi:hypothetical protein